MSYNFRPIMYDVPDELLRHSIVQAVSTVYLQSPTGDEQDKWMVFAFNRHNRAYMRTDAVLQELPCHNTTDMHRFDSAEDAFAAIVKWHENQQTIECPCFNREDRTLCKKCIMRKEKRP